MEEIKASIMEGLPRFILNDRNGKALANAIEHGVLEYLKAINGIYALQNDYETMPEWALDEIAYELNILWYDLDAEIENKRRWIKEARKAFSKIGTEIILKLLINGIYENCEIENYYDYGGELNEFKISVSNPKNDYYLKWSNKVIELVIPLRCKFGSMAYKFVENIKYIESYSINEIGIIRCGTVVCGQDIRTGLV